MKLVPVIMDYCQFQFYALKFFLRVRLYGGSPPNFNFFNVNPQIFQRNRKVHLSNCRERNLHDISKISLRAIRRRNYSLMREFKRKVFSPNINGVNEIK